MNGIVEIKGITHTVIKNEDIEKYLSKRQKRRLDKLVSAINSGRTNDGKKINSYHICNYDEPYANDVFTIILQGELSKGD